MPLTARHNDHKHTHARTLTRNHYTRTHARTQEKEELAEEQGALVKKHHTGFVGEQFLVPFVTPWILAEKDRSLRVRMIQSILEGCKTETTFDWSWWTAKTVETKLRKMALRSRAAAKKAATTALP